MQLGLIGLGRMGASLAHRLTNGHKCVVRDVSPGAMKKMAGRDIRVAEKIEAPTRAAQS